MKKSTIIIIVVVALLAIWGVSGYNGLVTMDENVSGQWSNVETQYQRRADLIPNLVNTVKGYASHEKETLEGVVEARSKATQMTVDANDLTPEKLAEYQKAQGAVTSALGKLLAITENYPDLKKLVENMYETMYESDGVGLAAPQIGLPIRLIVIDADVLKDTFPELEGVKMTLVNPELDILTDSPTVNRSEGCLSLPGLSENVVRHEKVRLNWLDTDFVEHEQVFEGFLARIIQHEYDHLDGILYVDRISPIRKQLIKTKLNNIARGRVRCDYKIKETRKH